MKTKQHKKPKPPSESKLAKLKGNSMVKMAAIFIIAFAVMEIAYNSARDTRFSEFLINTLTVSASASIIAALSPDDQISSQGDRILSPHTKLTVKVGCEGTETIMLLLAAIMAISVPWKQKLIGAIIGTLLVYGLNQVRVVSLFYALKHNKTLFDALHGYIAPIIIVVVVALFFSFWMSLISNKQNALSTRH